MKIIIKSFLLFFLFFQIATAQNNFSHGKLVAINGTKLFVKTMGSGEPIVMVHGGPGFNYQYFLPQFKVLAKHYKLIFYDQRASGKSSADVDSSSITMNNFVKDLEGIRKFFGLKKMNLYGHSWGGVIAMKYAIEYPENLKSLILSNTMPANSRLRDQTYAEIGPRTTRKDIAEKREITSTKKFANKDPETMAKYWKILYAPAFYNRKYIDSLNLTFPADYKKRSKLLNHFLKDPSFFKYDLTKELYKIKCPTLIVTGDYDLMIPESNKIIHRTIVSSKLVILKHCGHFPFVEDKKAYFKLLENFLSNLNKKK